MPADEGAACELAVRLLARIDWLPPAGLLPRAIHRVMACLAVPNLPLLAAFRRGSVRQCIAGREVDCPVGRESDQDLERRVAVILAHP